MKKLILFLSIFLIPSLVFASQDVFFGSTDDFTQPIGDCASNTTYLLQSFIPNDYYSKATLQIRLQNTSGGDLTGKNLIFEIYDGNYGETNTAIASTTRSLTAVPTPASPPFHTVVPLIIENMELIKNHFYWITLSVDNTCDSNNWIATSESLNTTEQVLYFSGHQDSIGSLIFDQTQWLNGKIELSEPYTPANGVCTTGICVDVLNHLYLIITGGTFLAGLSITKNLI